MKNSKFLKLISLALTVALLVAVAVPTLVTSAEDTTPAYVKELAITFEDGEKHTTASHVVTSDNEGVNGSKCIDITGDNKNNKKVFFNDSLMKAGVTYFVSFNYKCYQPGTNDNWAWFRPIQDDGATCGTDASYSQTSYDSSTQWRTFSQKVTPNKDTKFGIITQDGFYVDNFYVVEMSTENTATKQTYTFDTHSMPVKSSVSASVVVTEKGGSLTGALELNGANANNTRNPEIYMDLDFDLTIDKWYKISYDYKGKGELRIVPNNGSWGGQMYSIEAFDNYNNGNSINTNGEWHHNEAVFKAKYASSHILFLMLKNNEKLYIDNFVVEEYTPVESFTMDFENNDYGYNNYSMAADPLDETGKNRVLKCGNSDTVSGDYKTFYLPTMRLQKDRVYEISFKYYGGTSFRRDIRTSTGAESRNAWITPSTTEWKTATYCITIRENEDMGMIAIHCESTTYFDDFVIRDVTNTSTDSDKLDFSSETGMLLNHTENTTVTKVQDEQRETIVTKLTFNQSCNTDNGVVSLPFLLGSGKTYIVNMTYKSDVWVAMQWAEKVDSYEDRVLALNSNPLSPTSKWTTVTRYVTGKGTEFDTIHFYSALGGGNLYIADVTITEVTADGGLNGDDAIDAKDYKLMRNRIFSAKRDDAAMFEKYADQNGDSTVDVLDMVLLSKIGK